MTMFWFAPKSAICEVLSKKYHDNDKITNFSSSLTYDSVEIVELFQNNLIILISYTYLSFGFKFTEQTACCYMFVEGNPAPTFKFFKGTQEIIEGGRYKLISDGDNNNMIMMAIAKVKSADESEYRVYIENEHGSDEANFMLFVSGYFYAYLSI